MDIVNGGVHQGVASTWQWNVSSDSYIVGSRRQHDVVVIIELYAKPAGDILIMVLHT